MYFLHCTFKKPKEIHSVEIDVFTKGVSILLHSLYPSDTSASLRVGNIFVQSDRYPDHSRDSSASRTIWLVQGNFYIKATFDFSAM